MEVLVFLRNDEFPIVLNDSLGKIIEDFELAVT